MAKWQNLFEGPPGRLRPTFKQSSISSGMLHILGRMIGHSIIMDGQGFPFLSPPCYYYMCGYLDKALSLVQQDDVGDHVNHVIEQVILPLISGVYTYVHTRVRVCTCVYVRIHVYVYMYVYMCTCTYTCVCIHVYVYVCIRMYTHNNLFIIYVQAHV